MASKDHLPIWFITGCSSGFGLSLALLALRKGHKVIATSRNPSSTPEQVAQIEKLGGRWMKLDVTSKGREVEEVVQKATNVWGRIDILVNNAGFALLGAFEAFSDSDCRSQMETNFFAPMNLVRLILPGMRERKSGTIVNMSSTAGIVANPSRSLYSASKFALEAFSEALSGEVEPFGVRVLLVEPGAFRTNIAERIITGSLPTPPQYTGNITELNIKAVRDMATMVPSPAKGDVKKGVQAIFDMVMKEGQAEGLTGYLRLPLGKDGSAKWEVKIKELKENLDRTEKIWRGTDVDE